MRRTLESTDAELDRYQHSKHDHNINDTFLKVMSETIVNVENREETFTIIPGAEEKDMSMISCGNLKRELIFLVTSMLSIALWL